MGDELLKNRGFGGGIGEGADEASPDPGVGVLSDLPAGGVVSE